MLEHVTNLIKVSARLPWVLMSVLSFQSRYTHYKMYLRKLTSLIAKSIVARVFLNETIMQSFPLQPFFELIKKSQFNRSTSQSHGRFLVLPVVTGEHHGQVLDQTIERLFGRRAGTGRASRRHMQALVSHEAVF